MAIFSNMRSHNLRSLGMLFFSLPGNATVHCRVFTGANEPLTASLHFQTFRNLFSTSKTSRAHLLHVNDSGHGLYIDLAQEHEEALRPHGGQRGLVHGIQGRLDHHNQKFSRNLEQHRGKILRKANFSFF